MKLRYGSICSGIEAATVAWHPLGWAPAFFAEIEAFPSAVLAHHYPYVPNLGDMTAINPIEWRGKLDVLVGGTPCQAFSVAGQRKSLSDDRGNLTLKFVELVHGCDPEFVVWENVPGVLSTNDNAFGCFLAGLVGAEQPLVPVTQSGSWTNAGMVAGRKRTAAWRILDAQYFGLAQRRRRVFVVSCRTGDGHNPAAILLEPESLPRHSAPSRETGEVVAGTIKACSGKSGTPNGAEEADRLIAMPHVDISPALKSRDCKGPSSDGDGDGDGAILVPMLTHSLRADGFDPSEDGTGRGTPIVPVAFGWNKSSSQTMRVGTTTDSLQASSTSNPAVAFAQNQRNEVREMEIAGALAGEPGMKQQTYVYQCHGSNVGEFGTLRAGNGNETGGVPFTITGTNKTNRVAFETDISGSLRTKPPGSQENSSTTCIATLMAVRRLTPRECERLQGFTDDYTLITARGKPAADGPRYRALGNSMAVPVMRWIGTRIEKFIVARNPSEVAA